MKYLFVLLAVLLLLISCGEESFTPKPRAYPRIDFPKGPMDRFDDFTCSFSFEKPSYYEAIQDTTYFDKRPESPCWFNLSVPSLNGEIHCTYKSISSVKDLTKLVNDSYTFANKHNIKAEYIDDYFIEKPNKVYCRVLEIEGNVASPFQFFVTDSSSHFFRGSLYFRSQPNQDSLGPVVDFVKKDIMHMINTFEWK